MPSASVFRNVELRRWGQPVKSAWLRPTPHFCVLNIPSERNAKHEHNGKPHLHWMHRNRSAAHQSNYQAGKIPGATAGMENHLIAGMSHTRKYAAVRTPDQAAA
jgi:hypothetical protein